jgi:hypothetical protein
MAGLVVSKAGQGGVIINVPTQFETIDHLAKVILDDLTAGAGSGPNPHQDAIQLPDTLKTLTDMVSGDFSALPAAIDDATQTLMDEANTAIQSVTDGGALVASIASGAEELNSTVVAAMKQLDTLATSGTFADFQTAAAGAATFPNLEMGGVTEAFVAKQQFLKTTAGMNTQGVVGSAISQLNDVAKNAGTLGAAGALSTALASDIGLTAPPSINDAFAELQDGTAFNKVKTIAESMKAVKNVIDLGAASGHGDDLNDAIFQHTPVQVVAAAGTYAGQTVMQIDLEQAALNGRTPTDGEVGKINIPGWVNPNTGVTEYIPATKLQESLGQIQTDLLSKAASIQNKIVDSLAPIEELTSAIGLAVSSGNLGSALESALPAAVKNAMSAAKADVASNPHVDPTPPAGAPPEEGGAGRPK